MNRIGNYVQRIGWPAVLVFFVGLGTHCSSEEVAQPDLGLQCTATGSSACKYDAMMPPPPDGMMGPPPDGMMGPPADGMMGPQVCTLDSDCVNACPMSAKGCKCASPPMGTSKFCTPTCSVTADCPKPPMGTVMCDTMKGLCAIMP